MLHVHVHCSCMLCSMPNRSILYNVQNIGPEFCVQESDIARASEGYITPEDTKQASYIQYNRPVKHTIYM